MTENKNETPRELNLWDLCLICFRAVGNAFRWAWNFGVNTFRLSVQLWYIVLPVIILSVACGLYYSRKDNRIYKVGTMVHLSGVNRTDVSRLYESLALATPDSINGAQTLASQLGLTQQQASKLRKFATWGVIDYQADSIPDAIDEKNKHDKKDTVTVIMPNYLYLSFQTKAPQEAQEVGHAIIKFLNADTDLQKAYTAHLTVLQRRAEFCKTQINLLDSLTSVFYFDKINAEQVKVNPYSPSFVVGEKRLGLFHYDILYMLDKHHQVEKQLATASAPVVPMGDFVVNPKAVNGRLKCTAVALVLGYLLGCALAFVWKRRKQFAEWLQED